MTFSPKIILATAAFGLGLAVTAVSAQDTGGMAPASSASSMGQMHHGSMMHKMKGSMHKMNGSMHQMPATVTSVDSATGIVEVNSAGMSLRLHFPPASVADLKTGDKITLHMGFTK
ncbi:hypothetical protein [Rhodanobacter terrae]|jgi:hypothetical protein|uniref:Copper-binding protein n=1 Tax=Rhodanobacter terrae TaxID=418647 RepID=A0ABW0SZC1_9GAMM